jgi:UDP-N-acetylmuramoylalanine--D-glutamate ligase
MGLGVNQGGLGVAKWLLKRGARLTVTDLKDQHALASSLAELERTYILLARKFGKGNIHRIQYILGKHRRQDFVSADLVIQGPGVPRESAFLKIAKARRVPIETDLSLFFRLCPQAIVGVSGTRGKTTVTAMIGAMLRAEFGRVVIGGNIRKSPLDQLDGLIRTKQPVPVVLELSSWQLEGLKACRRSPHVAVLTNVMPDHLNRYRDMADYASAKELIYAWQTPDDMAIVPRNDAYTRKMGGRVSAERFWAASKPGAGEENLLAFRGNRAIIRRAGEETELFRKPDVRILGAHNLWNALLAAGAAYLRGVKPAVIKKTIRNFKGVPYRLEFVKTVGGVSYWNDTAATSPDGSIAALKTLSKKKNIILIAGGADKKLEFGEWARTVKAYAKRIILFEGTALPKILRSLKRAGVKPNAVVKTMTSAVWHARQAAKRGDTVLLSPGCASFGLFVNEFDRGDRFRAAVKHLR